MPDMKPIPTDLVQLDVYKHRTITTTHTLWAAANMIGSNASICQLFSTEKLKNIEKKFWFLWDTKVFNSKFVDGLKN